MLSSVTFFLLFAAVASSKAPMRKGRVHVEVDVGGATHQFHQTDERGSGSNVAPIENTVTHTVIPSARVKTSVRKLQMEVDAGGVSRHFEQTNEHNANIGDEDDEALLEEQRADEENIEGQRADEENIEAMSASRGGCRRRMRGSDACANCRRRHQAETTCGQCRRRTKHAEKKCTQECANGGERYSSTCPAGYTGVDPNNFGVCCVAQCGDGQECPSGYGCPKDYSTSGKVACDSQGTCATGWSDVAGNCYKQFTPTETCGSIASSCDSFWSFCATQIATARVVTESEFSTWQAHGVTPLGDYAATSTCNPASDTPGTCSGSKHKLMQNNGNAYGWYADSNCCYANRFTVCIDVKAASLAQTEVNAQLEEGTQMGKTNHVN